MPNFRELNPVPVYLDQIEKGKLSRAEYVTKDFPWYSEYVQVLMAELKPIERFPYWRRRIFYHVVLITLSLLLSVGSLFRVNGGWSIEPLIWVGIIWYTVLIAIWDFVLLRGRLNLSTIFLVLTGCTLTFVFPFTAIRKAHVRAQFRGNQWVYDSVYQKPRTGLFTWRKLPTSEIIPELLAGRLPVRGIRPFESLSINVEELDRYPLWLRKETPHITISLNREWNAKTKAGTTSSDGVKFLDVHSVCHVIRTCPNLQRVSLYDQQITEEIIDACLSRAPMELAVFGYPGKELHISREFDLRGRIFVILNNFNGLDVSDSRNKKLITTSSSVMASSGWLKAQDIIELLALNIDHKIACVNVDMDASELEKLVQIIGERSDNQQVATMKFPDLYSLIDYLNNTQSTINTTQRQPPKFDWSNDNMVPIMRCAMEKF